MAYIVNKTNATALPNSYTVQDSVLNEETELKFVGKGYAGYGETIAENFLHLLENFSGPAQPAKPISGQLWYDTDANRLKLYTGTTFTTLGGAPYLSSPPSGPQSGDLYSDSDTDQLYFYNGTAWVLVGPSSSATSGFEFATIIDSTDTSQPVTYIKNDGQIVAIVSDEAYTPKVSLSGFATISKGINLSTAVVDNKFHGTATSSTHLDVSSTTNTNTNVIAGGNIMRRDDANTTTGALTIDADGGLTIGDAQDYRISVTSNDVTHEQLTQDKDIIFRVNYAGSGAEVMRIDGSAKRIGILQSSPTSELDVAGTITATAFSGPLTGAVTGNVTGTASVATTVTTSAKNTENSTNYLTFSNSATGNNSLFTDTDLSYNPSSGLLNVVATSAQYADLAENYEADANYDVGTVVIFGGDKEVTQSTVSNDTRVAGVISENPAYLMNSDSEGLPIALVGKVKCKVHGIVSKGDLLTTCGTHPGCAQKALSPVLGSIVGKAMENKDTPEESVILISVGRL